jgi:hypothetical protein
VRKQPLALNVLDRASVSVRSGLSLSTADLLPAV